MRSAIDVAPVLPSITSAATPGETKIALYPTHPCAAPSTSTDYGVTRADRILGVDRR